MRARRSLALVATIACALGCSLVESFDGYTSGGGSDASLDAPSDVPVELDARDDAKSDSVATDAQVVDTAPSPTDAPIDSMVDAAIDTTVDIAPGCPSPGVICGGECVSLDDDPRHCGGCSTPCTRPGEYCAGGACTCGFGLTDCGSGCFDLEGDAQHCTACTTSCVDNNTCRGAHHELSGYFCVLNTYGCPSGTTSCPSDRGDVSCFSTKTDPTHCGDCATVCAIDQLCVAGSCRRYRPAVACTSAPCSCPSGSVECAPLPGGTDRLCVDGAACP